MTDTRPIGILDSGFGGLSVARAVAELLPQENLVYAADCGFAPWGDRTDDFILERTHALVSHLLRKDVKAIVIACNTATAVCAESLRAELSMPVVGIEPAVLPGARTTRTGIIGVMATTKTLASAKYRHLKSIAPKEVRIIDCPCPGLMDCVEAGEFRTPHTMALLREYVEPLVEAGADTLVLGCTHYPFLSDAEAQRFGTGKEEIGKCPRCGSPVYVGKGNFYCSNKECSFCLWEDNKFFSSKKKKLTKKIAKELLDKGWCRVTGLYTPKKPQLYDAVIRLDDSGGKYVSFKMEFDR